MIRISRIKICTNKTAGQGVKEKKELSYTVGGNLNWYSYYGEQCMQSRFSCVRHFATLWNVAHQALLSMGLSSKNTGICCHFCLQGIFLTQGANLNLLYHLHCRRIPYHQATWAAQWRTVRRFLNY